MLKGVSMDGAEQLIPSDKSSTGYRGVRPSGGRYQATCKTPRCHDNHLGTFDTSEEGAQAYLQHCEKEHPEGLEKERAPRPVLLSIQEHPHPDGQGADRLQGSASTLC